MAAPNMNGRLHLTDVYQNSPASFDILWGGKWDHHESENRTLNVI